MPQINQPSSPLIVDEEEVMMEKRKPEMTCLAIDRVEPRFYHYMKNVRVAAWARRFAENCKVKLSERKLGKFLSVHELRRGEQDLIMEIQSRHFPEKPDVKGFNVEKYDDGLWHLKTRLTNRERWNVSHVMGEIS
ncbi:unnamed protein product [Orchesella dallaii]|uniref:Uncharacterized protein n=1 Tax=Orchesella dallaii TaxID=48710 RepID=A0ABP1RXN1_9HEXA